MKRLLLTLACLGWAVSVSAQTFVTTTTTVAQALTDQTLTVADVSHISPNANFYVLVDREAEQVLGVSGLVVTVLRNRGGLTTVHPVGAVVYPGPFGWFAQEDPLSLSCQGTATANPYINLNTGMAWTCNTLGRWEILNIGPPGGAGPTINTILARVNVKDYGAKGDGTTDDSTAILNAYTAIAGAGGGTLFFPGPSTYRTTKRLNIQTSNTTVDGNGATLLFDPSDAVTNDRAIAIMGVTGSSGRAITGAIAKGAASFVATGSAADLVANDWLIVQETGDAMLDPYYVDWVQVASVAGSTVTLQAPFRMAFPGTHSTVTFSRASRIVKNIAVRNLTITSPSTSFVVGLTIGAFARQVTIDNCDIHLDATTGRAITTYLAADLTITNNRLAGTELAAVVDLVVAENTFEILGLPVAASGKAVELDFGTGFFVVANNRMVTTANIGVELIYGVHNGTVTGNQISWVTDAGIGQGSGIVGLGNQYITYTGNSLDGGTAGAGGTGLSLAADTTPTPNIASVGNFVSGNVITNFNTPLGPVQAADYFLQPSLASPTGMIAIPNGIDLLGLGSGTVGAPSLHWFNDPTVGYYDIAAGYNGFATGGTAGWAENNANRYMQSAFALLWTTSTPLGTVDLRLRRSAAKTLTLDDGAAGPVGLAVTGSLRASAVTFANLPATPIEGMLVPVTDSTTAVWGATITGVGGNHVLGYYNGSVWTVAGK